MIKKLDESYKEQLTEIAKQNFTDELKSTLLLIDSINDDNYLFLGNIVNNTLASYIIAIESLDDINICSIATKNEYKNKGLAFELIEYLKKQNIGEKKSISLEVKSNNIPAISLYTKCGFKTLSVRKKYYKDGTDAFCMFITK